MYTNSDLVSWQVWAYSADPDQTSPRGAVCILNVDALLDEGQVLP